MFCLFLHISPYSTNVAFINMTKHTTKTKSHSQNFLPHRQPNPHLAPALALKTCQPSQHRNRPLLTSGSRTSGAQLCWAKKMSRLRQTAVLWPLAALRAKLLPRFILCVVEFGRSWICGVLCILLDYTCGCDFFICDMEYKIVCVCAGICGQWWAIRRRFWKEVSSTGIRKRYILFVSFHFVICRCHQFKSLIFLILCPCKVTIYSTIPQSSIGIFLWSILGNKIRNVILSKLQSCRFRLR